ncbi:hypothetical protein M0804_004661 [Polistes exclamans]|nr:hypothetical protein M0804_004661 [Polistes exclamans]
MYRVRRDASRRYWTSLLFSLALRTPISTRGLQRPRTEIQKNHRRRFYNIFFFYKSANMFKYLILFAFVGLAWSAPAPAPKPAPAPAPYPLSVISEIKTPASTAKLTPLIAPIASPLISRLALLPQLTPYTYTYSAPVELAAVPSTYSVEQHGYHITY